MAEEYAGAQARFYRQYFSGVEGDEAFYLDLARRCEGPVLELGCGEGRLLLPLGRAGFDVVGLERSAAMLEALESRLKDEDSAVRGRVQVVEGDMADFALDRSFPLVLAPYRAFQHLLTPVDQSQSLVALRELLEPSGLVAFITYYFQL